MVNMQNDFVFPFPTKELAEQELRYDSCFAKIPSEDCKQIVEKAWEIGVQQAQRIYQKENHSYDFIKICEKSGCQIIRKNIDCVIGKQRYFSDYVSGTNVITLYMKSVEIWALENHLELETAIKLILSHEYFHFLEMNEIGQTSKIYQVPMLQIGPFQIGKTGIHALSEIGAHAFARTYYELSS